MGGELRRIDIAVAEFAAVIRAGRLVSVRAGKSKVSGALTVENVSVLRGELEFDLAATVPLGGGVPLV